ncbi:MAG: N-acetyltransferase [Litorimonas sp.]
MAASYSQNSENGSVLARVSQQIRAAHHAPACRLSPLVFMTDPKRTKNLVETVRRLPEECAVIYRHFGEPSEVQALRDLTAEQGRQLLIGNDPKLADEIKADGVHFSRDATLRNPIKWRANRPDWILTMAGLKDGAYLGPLDSLDALFVSSVFPSRSPSAGQAIGIEVLKDRAARLPVPIFALGGVNAGTALELIGSKAAGLAAIEGLIMDVQKQETSKGHRFVIETDAGEAELTLVRAGDGVFNANHTFTPTALRGQGVAGKLYDAMVADAKAAGYKIIPGCPYVEVKFKRNPEDRAAVRA